MRAFSTWAGGGLLSGWGERGATFYWAGLQALCHSSFVCHVSMSSTGAEGEVPGTMWGGGRSKTLGAGGEVAPDEGQGVDLVDRHDQEERGGEGREDEVENRSPRREDLNLFQHLAQTASVVGGNPEDAPPVGADVEKVSGNSCQVSHPWLDHQPGQKLTVSGFEEDGGGRGGSHCSVHEAVVLYEVQRGLGEGGGGIVTATRPFKKKSAKDIVIAQLVIFKGGFMMC